MVHSALTTRLAIVPDSEYSSRGGARIDSIGHHHAASTSLEGTLAQFQPGGRDVSANYCIKGKQIVLVVPEEFRAHTSASAQADARSITYEIVNTTGDPSWAFDADTLASVIALDADIRRRYGVPLQHSLPGFWEHRDLWAWFGWSYPTACAGPSFPMAGVIAGVANFGAVSTIDPNIRKRKIMSMPFILQQAVPSSPQFGVNVCVYADGTWEIISGSQRDVWLDLGAAFQNCTVPGRFEYHMEASARHRARTSASNQADVLAAFERELAKARAAGVLESADKVRATTLALEAAAAA